MLFFFISIECIKLLILKFGGSFSSEPFTGRTALSEVIPNLLLLQSWSSHTEYLSFNGPSWSISIEFYMYFIFIFTVVLLKKFKILFWASSSSLAFFFIYLNLEILTIQALRGISCFFGGAFIYTLYKKISHIFIPYLIGSIFEVSLIIIAVFTVQSKFELKPIIAPLVFLITVLLFSFESGLVSKALKIKPLQLTGKLSYSIYMTHTAILFFSAVITLILKKMTGINVVKTINSLNYIDLENIIFNNLVVFVVLAVVIFSSNFTYKYIELNGIKLGKKYM
jgi:peptidoglycan/LPS O-acetylase OafA/YrhL